MFSDVFDPILEKQALSKMDMLRLVGHNAKQSLVGSHGLKGVGKILSNPVSGTINAFREMPWYFQAMTGLGVAQAPFVEGGPGRKIGRTIGQLAPMPLFQRRSGLKSPGMLGGMAAQEVLGGGALVHKGILERGGEAVDDMFGWGKAPKPSNLPTPNTPNSTPAPITNTRNGR